MSLPEGFSHVLAEDLRLEQIWEGHIEAPNPRALDMLLAKHLRTEGYTFSYSEVSAILENFQHGDRDRNGTYLKNILKSAGFHS